MVKLSLYPDAIKPEYGSSCYSSNKRETGIGKCRLISSLSGFPADKHSNLYAFYAVPSQGHGATEMGTAIHEVIDKLKTDGVTSD